MWTLTLERLQNPEQPQEPGKSFRSTREALDWVENPDALTEQILEGVVAVGATYEDQVFAQAQVQIGCGTPRKVLGALVEAMGSLISPHDAWSDPVPEPHDTVRLPHPWPPPRPHAGYWEVSWDDDPMPGAWARSGRLGASGIAASSEWMLDRLAPLFSTPLAGADQDVPEPQGDFP